MYVLFVLYIIFGTQKPLRGNIYKKKAEVWNELEVT